MSTNLPWIKVAVQRKILVQQGIDPQFSFKGCYPFSLINSWLTHILIMGTRVNLIYSILNQEPESIVDTWDNFNLRTYQYRVSSYNCRGNYSFLEFSSLENFK